jgi:hypothetical protein
MKFNYEPTFPNVRGVHIGIIVAILLVVIWHTRGMYNPVVGDVNGDGSTTFVDVSSTQGWIAMQYNSLGSQAGAGVGESN